MTFTVCVFGSFSVLAPDGRDITPHGRKSAALLCYCVIAAPKPVRRERLAELLWGDRGDEQARASLRQALYGVRECASDDDGLIIIDRTAVCARRTAFSLDLDRLQDAAFIAA